VHLARAHVSGKKNRQNGFKGNGGLFFTPVGKVEMGSYRRSTRAKDGQVRRKAWWGDESTKGSATTLKKTKSQQKPGKKSRSPALGQSNNARKKRSWGKGIMG